MMCCNECPFNPVVGNAPQRCSNPVCAPSESRCATGFSARNLGSRCMLDYYVINRLYQNDELAQKLVFESLRSALIGRDRALILSIFHAADDHLRLQLWQWLEAFEPRSLWLLNPVFAAAGLPALDSFMNIGSHRARYLDAIISNPYIGRVYQHACF